MFHFHLLVICGMRNISLSLVTLNTVNSGSVWENMLPWQFRNAVICIARTHTPFLQTFVYNK
jgi:hypothetical protein